MKILRLRDIKYLTKGFYVSLLSWHVRYNLNSQDLNFGHGYHLENQNLEGEGKKWLTFLVTQGECFPFNHGPVALTTLWAMESQKMKHSL